MSAGHLPAMSNNAFAGFLRLLLTPLNEAPEPSTELQAYLEYLSRVSPATDPRRPRSAGTPSGSAA